MAFLPLIASLAPGLIRHFFGETAGEVTAQVADAAKSIFGTDDPQAIEQAIAKNSDLAFQFKAKLLDIQDRQSQREHEQRLEEIKDTANARGTFKDDPKVFWLGISVLTTFAVVVAGACYGAFAILTEGIQIKDVGVVAAVFGFLGTLVGYVAANAQQVISYFFGSSASSKQKTSELGDAFARLVKAR